MKRFSRPRATAELSEPLHQRLNKYALVAGAAGVSAVALTPSAEAKIVYTPANVVVSRPFPLDLNHDGIIDFYLLHSYSHFAVKHFFAACQFPKTYHGSFCFKSNSSNVIRASVGGSWAAALRSGAKIQHGDRFITRPGGEHLGEVCCHSLGTTLWYGPWMNEGKGVKNRYLGMKFKIKGRFHFGWARITITTTSYNFTATLTGYAYETIPGKEIVAGATKEPDDTEPTASVKAPTPKPATLGVLALGAPGLSIWRREESVPATPERN
jgi:hypothetical protein